VKVSSTDPVPDGGGVSQSLRVVAADPDPAWCEFYREVLPRLGHQVCVAATGGQLVEQCRLLSPDLVIAAAPLPDRDGLAAVERLCQDQPIPIILVPADDDAVLAARALGNPCVLACLHKPVKEGDLKAALALARSRFEQFQSLCREVSELRQALEDRKLIERAKGVLMKYGEVSEEEGYQRLRKLASVQNRKLVEVAQEILTAGEVFQGLGPMHERDQGSTRSTRERGRRTRSEFIRRLSADGRRTVPQEE